MAIRVKSRIQKYLEVLEIISCVKLSFKVFCKIIMDFESHMSTFPCICNLLSECMSCLTVPHPELVRPVTFVSMGLGLYNDVLCRGLKCTSKGSYYYYWIEKYFIPITVLLLLLYKCLYYNILVATISWVFATVKNWSCLACHNAMAQLTCSVLAALFYTERTSRSSPGLSQNTKLCDEQEMFQFANIYCSTLPTKE